ncbi:uncharacterized protein LOC112098187 [Citrus clementina]|uniref:uncharacterized protein LOC112098187 n=1 Tax=Citrus clementina TaxID=85681 RepID=UPI000CED5BF6|nr:uncharacterized protein LOC112098187 [Citrus x clementina]
MEKIPYSSAIGSLMYAQIFEQSQDGSLESSQTGYEEKIHIRLYLPVGWWSNFLDSLRITMDSDFTMSNRRGKLIVNESDEEVEDSYPNQLRPTGPLHPSSSVGPSYDRDTPEYPRPKAILPSSDFEPMGNRGGQASGSGENHSSEGAGVPEEVGDGEESSSKLSRPSEKINISHRMEADAYLIDYITCATTHTDLLKLRNLYNIPEEVLLVIPGKGDVPSWPPNGSASPEWVEGSFSLVCAMGKVWTRGAFPCGKSWGLIKNLDDTPLLNVETALVNASTCQDLLSSTNLVRSRLVDVAAGMDNKILSAMSRKRARGSGGSSNPPFL